MHEVFLFLNVSHTMPQFRKIYISFYDLYYTVIKIRIEKEEEEEYNNL